MQYTISVSYNTVVHGIIQILLSLGKDKVSLLSSGDYAGLEHYVSIDRMLRGKF